MAQRQAAFCISTGVQPSEYKQLTRIERDAMWKAAKQARGK